MKLTNLPLKIKGNEPNAEEISNRYKRVIAEMFIVSYKDLDRSTKSREAYKLKSESLRWVRSKHFERWARWLGISVAKLRRKFLEKGNG